MLARLARECVIMKKILLAGLIAMAAWTGSARGQTAFGAPAIGKPNFDACAPCQCGFGQLAQNMFARVRLAPGNPLPPCCPDAMSKEDAARLMCEGGHAP